MISPQALKIAASFCPFPLTGVTDECLGDVVDTWLADEFASEAHRHVHSWAEEDTL
jgi:hypothetical protein